MKTQLKKLNRISKIECLNPDNYYTVRIYKGEIFLQGYYNSELALQLTELFGKGKLSVNNGYIDFHRSNIEITLT